MTSPLRSLERPPAPPASLERAVEEVASRLEQITEALVEALAAQAVEPVPARSLRIADLGAERDALHEQLNLLEQLAQSTRK